MGAFVTDLKPGESLSIDKGRIRVTVLEKAGQRARLKIDADRSVTIEKQGASPAKIAAQGINVV